MLQQQNPCNVLDSVYDFPKMSLKLAHFLLNYIATGHHATGLLVPRTCCRQLSRDQ